MRKSLIWLFAMILLVVFAACNSDTTTSEESEGSSEESAENGDSEEETVENSYPEKNIEIYIPFSPGGDTDFSARAMTEQVKEKLGVDITVINQTGGGGATAVGSVVSSNPDGYTLFYNQQALFVGMATGQLEFELSDLTPIGSFAEVGQALVVRSDSGWENLDDFVQDAKDNPGKYNYGADFGATTHFMGGMLSQAAEIDINLLDGGGESERIAEMLGGHIDITATSTGGAKEYQDSGDFKVLAVLSEERDDLFPDVPTAQELGYDIIFPTTHILYGPADLDEEVIEVWDEAIKELVENEEYQNQLEEFGGISHNYKSLEELDEFIIDNVERIEGIKDQLGY